MRISRVIFPRSGVGRQPGGVLFFLPENLQSALTMPQTHDISCGKRRLIPWLASNFILPADFSLLISCASALAEADDDDDWDDNVDDAWEMEHPLHSGDYAYALLDDGTVEITSYGGADTEIVIPDTLDGKPVTAIGERAFITAFPDFRHHPRFRHLHQQKGVFLLL